jgi:PAS domain-containing protein
MFESPELEQLLGGSTSSRKGVKWCDMVHEEDRAAMTAAFEANVREPQHAAVVSVARLRRSDGGWLRRAILCQPMTEVPGPALISIGIRPLPEDEPKTPRRRRAAPKATARMTTQVCTLNNILALISGHAQLANMLEHVDPEMQRHLAVIVEAADRASATLGKIVS